VVPGHGAKDHGDVSVGTSPSLAGSPLRIARRTEALRARVLVHSITASNRRLASRTHAPTPIRLPLASPSASDSRSRCSATVIARRLTRVQRQSVSVSPLRSQIGKSDGGVDARYHKNESLERGETACFGPKRSIDLQDRQAYRRAKNRPLPA
jgi:hypothetical protein